MFLARERCSVPYNGSCGHYGTKESSIFHFTSILHAECLRLKLLIDDTFVTNSEYFYI